MIYKFYIVISSKINFIISIYIVNYECVYFVCNCIIFLNYLLNFGFWLDKKNLIYENVFF